MKVQKNKTTIQKQVPSAPQVTPLPNGKTEIWHSEEVKLSRNYQTVGCSFGMKVTVDSDQKSVRRGQEYVQEQITSLMQPKVQEYLDFLAKLDS